MVSAAHDDEAKENALKVTLQVVREPSTEAWYPFKPMLCRVTNSTGSVTNIVYRLQIMIVQHVVLMQSCFSCNNREESNYRETLL
jgi:hypothetical protein